ncbi:hypothetical protein CVT25_000225 [Psilocybe cyanescens]|uniref:Ty3 transposon capsid-like protein domain-containing protein n=1 Tax=Psilocybe cyanescens TaxID=93625 RepID=A0A409W8T6_PSICY|nr:hypothetical protein CVT25_000225 [Psilocybe cyanescens]
MVETTTTNGKKEITINKPIVFNGDRIKSKSFLEDCYLYIDINEDIYDSKKKKIAFILSFCGKAEAKLWKEQYITSRTRETPGNQTFAWETLSEFIKKFHNAFTAVKVIINKFKLLVGQANLGMETELDHTHLIGLFQKCIRPQLADKIMYSDDLPRTIQGWYKKATQFNTNYRPAKVFKEKTSNCRRTPQLNNSSRYIQQKL